VPSDTATETGPLCAQWARQHRVDPIGTIGSYLSFLLVEWPLPWPRDVADIPGLEPLREKVRQRQGRLQLIVPEERVRGHSRAVLFCSDPGPFTRYRRAEVSGSTDEIVSLASELMDHRDSAVDAEGRDLLVCTHGSRDRCCGSLGTKLERALESDLGHDYDIRLWRTSHTGGHRFAPTAILFPEGTGWGFLDEATVQKIVRRSDPVADVLLHYRGCAALTSRRVQALERAILAEAGWSLFDCSRQGSEERDGTVTMDVSHPGGPRRWSAQVRSGRTLPVPGCGTPIRAENKTEDELVVADLQRLTPYSMGH
jgi:hypothetical protein